MQKSSVRMCSLAFDIRKKCSTHLPGQRYTNHRGVRDRLPLWERQCSLQVGHSSTFPSRTYREWVFKAKEEICSDKRRTRHLTCYLDVLKLQVDQTYVFDRKVALYGGYTDDLAQVGRAVSKNNTIVDANFTQT